MVWVRLRFAFLGLETTRLNCVFVSLYVLYRPQSTCMRGSRHQPDTSRRFARLQRRLTTFPLGLQSFEHAQNPRTNGQKPTPPNTKHQTLWSNSFYCGRPSSRRIQNLNVSDFLPTTRRLFPRNLITNNNMLLLICSCAACFSIFIVGFSMVFLGLNSDFVAPPKPPPSEIPAKKKDPPILARSNSLLPGSWLAHGHPMDSKHFGWLHPLSVAVVHYFLMFATILPLHDRLVEYYYENDDATKTCEVEPKLQTLRDAGTVFLWAYAAFVIVWRVFFRHEPGHKSGPVWYMLYDYCWLCNVSLWMGGWALHTGRPILAQTLCITVGLDQISWYVDLIGYGLTRKWPVGAAKYLTWPEYAK